MLETEMVRAVGVLCSLAIQNEHCGGEMIGTTQCMYQSGREMDRTLCGKRDCCVLLSRGQGNPPAFWFGASGLVWFGSLPRDNPQLLSLLRFVTPTGKNPSVFGPGSI